MGNRKIRYGFELENKNFFQFDIEFDSESNNYISKKNLEYPEWTKLEFNQCENCPLTSSDCERCPVAANLFEVVEETKNSISHEKARVVVQTQERSYAKSTSIQDGLFSLFGVIMATSGCPHLNWLKPMARFHLPFATIEETLYRSLSMFLTREYLGSRKGQDFDQDLVKMKKRYEEIEIVNSGILARIRSFADGDADKNAIVALNIFAQMFNCEMDNDFGILNSLFDDLD